MKIQLQSADIDPIESYAEAWALRKWIACFKPRGSR